MMSFLQSREWAEIQKRDGREAHRLQFGDEECNFFRHRLPFGFYYYYAPRPIIRNQEKFFASVTKFGESTGAIFFRVEPESGIKNQDSEFRVQNSGFRIVSAPNSQPLETILMDLTKPDEELLAAMHPKTRYNIRLAEKHGLVIRKEKSGEAISDFYKLLRQTAGRDRFNSHSKLHYQNLLMTFSYSAEYENVIFEARYDGQLAAAAIVNFCGGTATYLHGASDYSLRHLMAPYLLHWRIMQIARERGCQTYDLWGIDEARWPGVTRFKMGFGGERKFFPAAFDIVLRPFWYRLYTLIRRFR